MMKRKRIYSHAISITQSYNEGSGDAVYEVKKEQFECEYSEEWTQNSDDPIKEYVENAIENVSNKSFADSGYSWDEQNINVNFSTVTFDGAYHILCKNGVPVELYYIE